VSHFIVIFIVRYARKGQHGHKRETQTRKKKQSDDWLVFEGSPPVQVMVRVTSRSWGLDNVLNSSPGSRPAQVWKFDVKIDTFDALKHRKTLLLE